MMRASFFIKAIDKRGKPRVWLNLLLTGILSLLFTNTSFATSYPAVVVWNHNLYGLGGESIALDQIGVQIGEVKRQIHPMPKKDGDSNSLPAGTRLYEVKGVSTGESIAVERDGTMTKARYINKFETAASNTISTIKALMTVMSYIAVAAVFFMVGIFVYTKARRHS